MSKKENKMKDSRLYTPVTYIDNAGKVQTDRVKVDQSKDKFQPSEGYDPTKCLGVCSICRTVGTLDFISGFSYKVGDRVMNRQKVSCYCPTCRKKTEFIPLIENGKTTEEGRKWLVELEAGLNKNLKGE
jgi:hypothetical protein